MFDKRFNEAITYFRAASEMRRRWRAMLKRNRELYGGDIHEHTLVAGGMFDHWPRAEKDAIWRVIGKYNTCIDSAYAARPHRVHMATMRKLQQSILV